MVKILLLVSLTYVPCKGVKDISAAIINGTRKSKENRKKKWKVKKTNKNANLIA